MIEKNKKFTFQVDSLSAGQRLDSYLAENLRDFSRSRLSSLITTGNIQIEKTNQKTPDHESRPGQTIRKIRPALRIEEGMIIKVNIPEEKAYEIEPHFIDFPVLYEDSELAVIIKPPGIAVHPGPTETHSITLAHGIKHRWGLKDDSLRPGIVHRLDMPTEGLMVIALNSSALWKLSRSFQRREVKKAYLAWLLACPEPLQGTVNLPIKRHRIERKKMTVDPTGRKAITHYRVEQTIVSKKGRKFALASIDIETGRTHQIRVHMAHYKAPIVGDPQYSRSAAEFKKYGMLLLAQRLSFPHPVSGKTMDFTIEEPERFQKFRQQNIHY